MAGTLAGWVWGSQSPPGTRGPRVAAGGLLFRLGRHVGALSAVMRAFGDTGLLAAQTAQIIELGAAHLAAAHQLDRVDHRRVQRKHALDALAVRDFAYRKALVQAVTGAGDADAL